MPMENNPHITQHPEPGTGHLRFRGDTFRFTLALPQAEKGSAWLRTNIGHGAARAAEILAEVHSEIPPLGHDWFDVPMTPVDERRYQITLPLGEVGHYEAKCFFIKAGDRNPTWPAGPNTTINVEPADTCCANIIYNAFVRQFGPNRSGDVLLRPQQKACVEELDRAAYTVIPPSGTFRDLIRELDFIFETLGCRILQLLPIHPTPTTYGRMGRFGSPFAALSFTAVDPALAEFDPGATPLEQFTELVDGVHRRSGKIIIDIAINHTGWAASLHGSHPEWLARDDAGRIEVPGAWGVRWEDLARLDYAHQDLWQYMAQVFLTWCYRGVDGFRCDAGYMIPAAAWKYMIACVRQQFPDTIFLLEGLGGPLLVTRELLNRANFNWAYSELFQNYDRGQIEHYLSGADEISRRDGLLVHFAETHDNNRLAGRSKAYARMRTALCALTSPAGTFGFANGVEWFATEKIDVHDANSLNWGASDNQVAHIRRLNALLKCHPAFHDRAELRLIEQGKGNSIALLRHHTPSGKRALVVANLDPDLPNPCAWDPGQMAVQSPDYVDLLRGAKVSARQKDGLHGLALEPGQVLCLVTDPGDLELVSETAPTPCPLPERIIRQRQQAKVFDVFSYYNGVRDLGDFATERVARSLAEDPADFCRAMNLKSPEPRVIVWRWPVDRNREVMLPPKHFLLVRAPDAFRAQLMDDHRCLAVEESLPQLDGSFFALFAPLARTAQHRSLTLRLVVFEAERPAHADAPLLRLAGAENARVCRSFQRSQVLRTPLLLLGTNGRGGMMRAQAAWGVLHSRYDALLAANPSPIFPEDRWVLLARYRAWVVFQGYSQEICLDCLERFRVDPRDRGGYWDFRIPTGQGGHVRLTIWLEMASAENSLNAVFYRHPAQRADGSLPDRQGVQLIVRPDIESRNFHHTTKAYLGPEHQWPNVVQTQPDGFGFTPDPAHRLQIQISRGAFVFEPEWQYTTHRLLEAERGLDPDSDLFSPGYFNTELEGNQTATLRASAPDARKGGRSAPSAAVRQRKPPATEAVGDQSLPEVLIQSLKNYIVRRGELKSVIAGYPWFLDWGRDALIAVRGIIAAGFTEDALAVMTQFGRLEQDGTLPNMIQGDNAANRDTSDAPLWFFVACSDLRRAKTSDSFLDAPCGARSLRRILTDMGRALLGGLPNGVRMDPDSGLIFSPPHFTWMDTNFPAGTPREGYPIEIQALWYAALRFLDQIDIEAPAHDWNRLARQVQDSILELFWRPDAGFLSDCLHAPPGTPARQASADDALRPNQLLCLSLGAVADPTLGPRILYACQELLVPGAVRSLADRPVRHPLPIVHQGRTINDPHRPYQGVYAGDEDSRRKPAYHNGTAWTWLFPSFCEAWARVYGTGGIPTALAWLSSSLRVIAPGCCGHVPEILDGDFPHRQRGCDAQAWGASELLRVWLLLTQDGHSPGRPAPTSEPILE